MRVGGPRTGYTLLEVLLVMAILVILSMVFIPSLDGMYGDTRVRGAGDDVHWACAEARSRAIETGVSHRLAIYSDNIHYRVAPDTDDAWADAPASVNDDGKTLVGALPKTVIFQNPVSSDNSDSGGWKTIAVFQSDGTCKHDAQVVLQPDDGSPLVVHIRALTGAMTVKTRKQEESQ